MFDIFIFLFSQFIEVSEYKNSQSVPVRPKTKELDPFEILHIQSLPLMDEVCLANNVGVRTDPYHREEININLISINSNVRLADDGLTHSKKTIALKSVLASNPKR